MKTQNELIANFMGVDLNQVHRKETHFKDGKITIESKDEDVSYHNSWDYLMPVILKIGNLELKFKNTDDYFNPYPMTFGMQSEEGMYLFRFAYQALYDHQNLIEAAYEAVVDFINSYNSDKD